MRTAEAPFSPGAGFPLAEEAGLLLTRLGCERPRVHAVTNAAAQVLTANLLLAAGAVPSLTVAPDEISAFTLRAGALLINLGTLDTERRAAIPAAIATARQERKPWVLDPVFVEASPSRLAFARLCLAGGPAILRCNGAEFEALADAAASEEAVRAYARRLGSVVALTGAVDHVTDGSRSVFIENGHALMTRITAMGCAAAALVAAFAALGAEPLVAAASGLLAVGVAGEIAAEAAHGPGSFVPAYLDAVFGLDAAALASRARLA